MNWKTRYETFKIGDRVKLKGNCNNPDCGGRSTCGELFLNLKGVITKYDFIKPGCCYVKFEGVTSGATGCSGIKLSNLVRI